MSEFKVIDSTLNDVGKNFDYRKKEILFDRFKMFFDNTTFTLRDSYMGWGTFDSDCGTLVVHTASFDGGCYLDNVRHTSKANNPYNNFVNAIAYWNMLNENGRKFFLDFYREDILKIKTQKQSKILNYHSQIDTLIEQLEDIEAEIKELEK